VPDAVKKKMPIIWGKLEKMPGQNAEKQAWDEKMPEKNARPKSLKKHWPLLNIESQLTSNSIHT
jgi:hypothetical protein